MRTAVPTAPVALLCLALWAAGACGSSPSSPRDGAVGADAGPDGAGAGKSDWIDEEGCRPPREPCAGECVHTGSDPQHCGACGHRCEEGEVCLRGECQSHCTGAMTECDSSCVDLATHPGHCGQCSNECADDRICMHGECICGEGLEQCDGGCVDPRNDPDHCGRCGHACGDGEACSEGSCKPLREIDCTNEVDDDGDGLVDCEDDDCTGTTRPCEGGCRDGIQSCREDGRWGECSGCAPPPECGPAAGECDYGLRCADGACELDPDALWDIVVVDADVPTENLHGGCWDHGAICSSPPDVYAEIRVGGDDGPEGRTSVASNTYEPEWNETVLVDVSAGQIHRYLRFELRDSDRWPSADDPIGHCVLRELDESTFGGDLLAVSCPRDESVDSAGFRLRFRIERP